MKGCHEDTTEKLMLTVTPDAASHHIKKEKVNSPTHLLAVTFTFKMINKLGGGTTQRKMQGIYEVKAKQLATCITGCKYLGGGQKKGPKT